MDEPTRQRKKEEFNSHSSRSLLGPRDGQPRNGKELLEDSTQRDGTERNKTEKTVVAMATTTTPPMTMLLQRQTMRTLRASCVCTILFVASISCAEAFSATSIKQELLGSLSKTPTNAATSRELTDTILDQIPQLEATCPTREEDVLNELSGTWELLWTAQVRDKRTHSSNIP